MFINHWVYWIEPDLNRTDLFCLVPIRIFGKIHENNPKSGSFSPNICYSQNLSLAATGIEPGLRGVDMYNHLIFARDCGDRSQFLKESPRILEKHRADDFFFRGSDCDFRFRGSDDF